MASLRDRLDAVDRSLRPDSGVWAPGESRRCHQEDPQRAGQRQDGLQRPELPAGLRTAEAGALGQGRGAFEAIQLRPQAIVEMWSQLITHLVLVSAERGLC